MANMIGVAAILYKTKKYNCKKKLQAVQNGEAGSERGAVLDQM
jgi:hypothetical protein